MLAELVTVSPLITARHSPPSPSSPYSILPLRMRVAAATPKDNTPENPAGISALKDELQTLEIDATTLKDPTEDDMEQIRSCLQGFLDLIQVGPD